MLDKFMYKFFGAMDAFANGMDKLFSKMETVAINISTWLWSKRVKILRRKRARKNDKM
jgi:hypothetical protein|tara:strand:+ start:583 stop:756 length:174 start_codon:yes stop_codon:yes gene_type:complete